jgi:hypothetical protein
MPSRKIDKGDNMPEDIERENRMLNLLNCCERLRLHIDANLFEQLRKKIAEKPAQSQALAQGYQIDLSSPSHMDVIVHEDPPKQVDIIIKPHNP